MQPRNRKPTTPGELLSEMLGELELMTGDLARHIGEPVETLIGIIDHEERVTPELARKFGGAFAQSFEFWLNAQLALDIWNARHKFEPAPMLLCVRVYLTSIDPKNDLTNSVLTKGLE